MQFLKSIDRRDFVKIISIAGLGSLIYPKSLISKIFDMTTSRVVIIFDEQATTGNSQSGYKINKEIVQKMIDTGLKVLTDKNTLEDAWSSILPNLNPNTRIALKINCLNQTVPTHPEVTYSVAESLLKLNFNTIPFTDNNIIIYDDQSENNIKKSGYTINKTNLGIRCVSNNTSGIGYSSESYNVAGSSQKLSRVVTELSDYIINISVLKNHSGAGVTLCLKNHYGTVNNPGGLHGNSCNPYIPALNALEPIAIRQKLFICDALFGIRSGGPGGNPQFNPKMILMSNDIVSLDFQGAKLLEENGCQTVATGMKYINEAAKSYALGINDPNKIEIIKINNPSTGIDEKSTNNIILSQNYPNPFSVSTQIDFDLPYVSKVKFLIFNISGEEVICLIDEFRNKGKHSILWNGMDKYGIIQPSGIYIGKLTYNNINNSIIMNYQR